jgi:hypothetical protein
MSTHIALHPWVVCLGFGGCVGFVYFPVRNIIWSIDDRSNHKTGTGTDTQEWLYALSDFITGFPFHSLLTNSFAWALVGAAVFAVLLWRRRRAA